jgi:hypothetical protein
MNPPVTIHCNLFFRGDSLSAVAVIRFYLQSATDLNVNRKWNNVRHN